MGSVTESFANLSDYLIDQNKYRPMPELV